MLLSALSFLASGCSAPGRLSGSQSRVITEAEIIEVSASTVYELVERLRPLWLRDNTARSFNLTTETAVVENGFYIGSLDSMRWMSPGGVRELRYLTGSEAAGSIRGVPRGRSVAAVIVIYRSRE